MQDFFVDLVNYLLTGIGIALGWILQFFPDSPFGEPVQPPEMVNLGYINWLIPFTDMILHFTLLLSAAVTYYSVRVAARWIKMVKE